MKVIVGPTSLPCDLVLVPGKNLISGHDAYLDRFGDITSLENDFLILASSIYTADLACKREERERFLRDIELVVPIVNIQAFQRIKDDLEYALYILSCDNWSLEFIPSKGKPEPTFQWPHEEGRALLFSGGLDSLCAAATFLGGKDPLLLVSHVTHNRVVETAQVSIHRELQKLFKRKAERLSIKIHARSILKYPFPRDTEREDSQRTRSFLFLVLASLAARRVGYRQIIHIAENGQFAIHLPLTGARVGPFSTHTAHPEFLFVMQRLLRTALACNDLTITNPYLYMTKAEVLASINKEAQQIFPLSVSCWRGSRVKTRNHCGECIPCLARRIALESLDLPCDEYERDLLSARIGDIPADDIGKRNLIELLEFIFRFAKYSDEEEDRLIEWFPELVNEHFDRSKAIDLYVRFANEALAVLRKYKNLKSILQ